MPPSDLPPPRPGDQPDSPCSRCPGCDGAAPPGGTAPPEPESGGPWAYMAPAGFFLFPIVLAILGAILGGTIGLGELLGGLLGLGLGMAVAMLVAHISGWRG